MVSVIRHVGEEKPLGEALQEVPVDVGTSDLINYLGRAHFLLLKL